MTSFFSEGRKLSWWRWLILFWTRIWPDEVFNGGNFTWRHIVHPWSSRWNIIMELWKIIFLWKWVICRFHLNLPGCIFPYRDQKEPPVTTAVCWKQPLGFSWHLQRCEDVTRAPHSQVNHAVNPIKSYGFSPRLQDFIVMCLRFAFVFFVSTEKMHCFVMKFLQEIPHLSFLS